MLHKSVTCAQVHMIVLVIQQLLERNINLTRPFVNDWASCHSFWINYALEIQDSRRPNASDPSISSISKLTVPAYIPCLFNTCTPANDGASRRTFPTTF